MSQHDPVYPDGHWQVNEQEFWLKVHAPLFKHGFELHGLVQIAYNKNI